MYLVPNGVNIFAINVGPLSILIFFGFSNRLIKWRNVQLTQLLFRVMYFLLVSRIE